MSIAYVANSDFDLKVTPRPDRHSESVRALGTAKTVDKIVKWAEDVDPFPNDEEKEDFTDKVRTFLVKKSMYETDGFQLAKSFENDTYCEGDSALVDILDNLFFGILEAEKKSHQAWVNQYGIKLAAKEGDKIFFSQKRFGKDIARHEGIVATCYPDEAKYSICVEALGHRKPGEKGTGTYGTIVNAEDAELP